MTTGRGLMQENCLSPSPMCMLLASTSSSMPNPPGWPARSSGRSMKPKGRVSGMRSHRAGSSPCVKRSACPFLWSCSSSPRGRGAGRPAKDYRSQDLPEGYSAARQGRQLEKMRDDGSSVDILNSKQNSRNCGTQREVIYNSIATALPISIGRFGALSLPECQTWGSRGLLRGYIEEHVRL